ncbi:NETI motif-containing protein [Alkalibacillus haloalkaliphilus]|uniref:NETI motif-containing protein n=1 Tax=Alkalibacillus haloalkaliphilus TaxID=94136 RepID=UPI0002DF6AB3|nr:NETI motif-containing protein [Alkalibacillus haloalkaliphilus]
MKKKKYRVSDFKSIDACLDQIKEDGFTPVKRIEKPVFQEQGENEDPQPIQQDIVFEAVKKD